MILFCKRQLFKVLRYSFVPPGMQHNVSFPELGVYGRRQRSTIKISITDFWRYRLVLVRAKALI